MEDLKTIFYLGGTSGAGKSTRVYALIRFFEDRGDKPTGTLMCNEKCVGREYLNSFYIIGKEYLKNGALVWQGLDNYVRTINAGQGSERMYKFFYETARVQNLVLDSAALLSSNRSRPLALENYGVAAKTYARFYWYDSFEEYKQRIAGRNSGKVMTEDSAMWQTNSRFHRYGELQKEEEKFLKHPERYEFFHGSPTEPVWTIGKDILERIGHAELVDEFKTYADSFLETHKTPVVESEELF